MSTSQQIRDDLMKRKVIEINDYQLGEIKAEAARIAWKNAYEFGYHVGFCDAMEPMSPHRLSNLIGFWSI